MRWKYLTMLGEVSNEGRARHSLVLKRMARVTGLEPATSGVTGRHSNQLSYTRIPLREEEKRRLRATQDGVKRNVRKSRNSCEFSP